MSGWIVINFESINERRDFTEGDSVEYESNPNWDWYVEQFDEGISDDEFAFPRDEIQRRAVEEFGAYTDRLEGVVYAVIGRNGPWRAMLDETVELWDQAAVIHANDTTDTGDAKVFQSMPDTADEEAVTDTYRKVDEYSESQDRGEYRVGDKAAAYVSFNYGFTAESRRPVGRQWDSTTAMDHDTLYRVLIDDPTNTPAEFNRGGLPFPQVAKNDVLRTHTLYPNKDAAEEKADALENRFGVETTVEAVPVEIGWHGGVEREFDPRRYPSYNPLVTEEEDEELKYPNYRKTVEDFNDE